jgi:hypothetical protein
MRGHESAGLNPSHGRGAQDRSRYVKRFVIASPTAPAYDWALSDDWAGAMPPEADIPEFIERWETES